MQRSVAGKSVLSIQRDESIRSSDEFEKPPRPPIRKSVSAGMLRKNKSTKGSSKHKSFEEDDVSRKSERRKNSKSELKNKTDEDNVETDEVYSRLPRKRLSRYDLKKMFDLEDEVEEEVQRKKRPLSKKKNSKIELKEIDSDKENEIISKRLKSKTDEDNVEEDKLHSRKLRKRSSRFDLKKLHASEYEAEEVPETTSPLLKTSSEKDKKQIDTSSEKSSLNSTFTMSQEELDITDAGLKRKRKLFNAKESFFNPVEFENADM